MIDGGGKEDVGREAEGGRGGGLIGGAGRLRGGGGETGGAIGCRTWRVCMGICII